MKLKTNHVLFAVLSLALLNSIASSAQVPGSETTVIVGNVTAGTAVETAYLQTISNASGDSFDERSTREDNTASGSDSSYFAASAVPPAAVASAGAGNVGDDSGPGKPNTAGPQTGAQRRFEQSSASPVVAVVAGTSIHEDDLDRSIGHDAAALKEKLYALRKQALESMIDSLLLQREAERLKVSENDLLKDRLKIPGISAADLDREWANNYEALRPMGEVMGRYRVLLDMQSHARTEAFGSYLAELRQQNDVKVFLEKPTSRLTVRTGASTLGPASAPSELVVFMDYECPFCRKLDPELKSLLTEEPLRSGIRVTVKQFPLSIHHDAFEAALSAVCAGDQHKFAPMHDLLIAHQDHGRESLIALASQAGLERKAFEQCLSSERATNEVLRDMDEGRKGGVQGTPALFLDGQMIELPDNPQDLGKQLAQSMRKTEDSAAVNKDKEHGK